MKNSLSKASENWHLWGYGMWQEGEGSKEIDPLPHGMWFKTNRRWKSNLCNLLTSE